MKTDLSQKNKLSTQHSTPTRLVAADYYLSSYNIMRRQSPSSSGLLPASYSRRRRNRPNESLVAGENYNGANITQQQQQHSSTYNSYYSTNNDTYEDVGSVSSSNNDNNFGLRTRGSPTRQAYTDIDAQQNSYYNDYDTDDENDENYNRNNNHYNSHDVYEQGYEDVLDKPLKLSDFLINDRCYHRYLLEGKRSSYRGIINGVKASTDDGNKGFMDPIFLAKVSTICSFIGMLFLLFVAIIIETQPLYIKGVKVYSSNQNEEEYRFRKETSNALKASAAYFLTMVLSIIYIQAPSLELNPAMGRICHLKRLVVSTYFRYRRRHYDTIPDNNGSIFGGGGSSSTSGSILPTHSSSANGSEGDKLLKSRRRKKRSSKRKSQDGKHDDDDDHGGKGGGVLGKIKSWGIMGGGSSQTVRKKDR